MPLDVAVAPTTLTSTLHYLKRGTEKPASYRIEPPPGVPRWNGIDDPHDVKIEDARGRESEYEQVRAVPLDALRYWHYTTVSRTPGGFAAFTANKQLPDPNSLFAASVATRCARRDRPEAGRRPRYRKFESISLQQGVTCELDFGRDAEGERFRSRTRGRESECRREMAPPPTCRPGPRAAHRGPITLPVTT